jgi:hypothetical protein
VGTYVDVNEYYIEQLDEIMGILLHIIHSELENS